MNTMPLPAPLEAPRSWSSAVLFVVLCELAGATGAVATSSETYRELPRPEWAPPSWLFGPVWITLYAVMGIAAWLVWRTGRGRRLAMIAFAVQLAINAAWSPVFFGARSPSGGLALIVLLDVAIAVTIALYARRSAAAAWMMVPYAAWVGFATVLNASIVAMT